jgi:hypothetical protein
VSREGELFHNPPGFLNGALSSRTPRTVFKLIRAPASTMPGTNIIKFLLLGLVAFNTPVVGHDQHKTPMGPGGQSDTGAKPSAEPERINFDIIERIHFQSSNAYASHFSPRHGTSTSRSGTSGNISVPGGALSTSARR